MLMEFEFDWSDQICCLNQLHLHAQNAKGILIGWITAIEYYQYYSSSVNINSTVVV